MTAHSSKYLLAYYLADQLDPARKYSKEEIEQFIASERDGRADEGKVYNHGSKHGL